MTLKDTCKQVKMLCQNVLADLEKAEGGNKAASQRVRTGTIRLEKAAKLFRKESIKSEKNGGGKRKKAAPAKAAPKKAKKAPMKKPTAKIMKKKK